MRKIYTFLFALALFMQATAQVNVTFTVDMSETTVSADGVHLAGSFQGWDPAGTPLTDLGSGVYSITLALEAGEHEFKFINGDDWPFEEVVPDACRANLSGNTNRRIVVGADDNDFEYSVCFESCAACGDYAVLFRVDMSLEEEVAPQGVHVAGEFQGWNPGANRLFDEDGDGIYTALITFNPAVLDNGNIVFKYINGNDWPFPNENVSDECGAGGNRVIALTEANTVLPAFCFGQCGPCVAPVSVAVRVDMSNETVSGDGVHVAGEFQGWNPSGTPMTEVEDGIYEVILDLSPGTYEFKFINGNDWGQDESVPSACAQNNNRFIEVLDEADQSFQSCFGQCAEVCSANPDPAEITFSVNAADIDVSATGLWLIGNFTSPPWQGGAVEMIDDNGDDVYTATVMVSGAAEFQYKFTNGDPFPGGVVDATVEETYDFSVGLCGVPNGIGGFNRVYVRTGEPEILPVVCYNSCVDCGENVAEQKNAFGIRMYPNPANDRLFVSTDRFEGMAEMTIFDASGRSIRTTSINLVGGHTEVVNVADLARGMYILHLRAGAKVSSTTFLKQ